MTVQQYLDSLKTNPEQVSFTQTMEIIEQEYNFTEVSFVNGGLENAAGENSGSCKLFAFAKLNGITEQLTLHCFGDYYRVEVLQAVNGSNHMNIRNFMKTGWQGIEFTAEALQVK